MSKKQSAANTILLIPPGLNVTYEINKYLTRNGYQFVREIEPSDGGRRFEVIKAVQGMRKRVRAKGKPQDLLGGVQPDQPR